MDRRHRRPQDHGDALEEKIAQEKMEHPRISELEEAQKDQGNGSDMDCSGEPDDSQEGSPEGS